MARPLAPRYPTKIHPPQTMVTPCISHRLAPRYGPPFLMARELAWTSAGQRQVDTANARCTHGMTSVLRGPLRAIHSKKVHRRFGRFQLQPKLLAGLEQREHGPGQAVLLVPLSSVSEFQR